MLRSSGKSLRWRNMSVKHLRDTFRCFTWTYCPLTRCLVGCPTQQKKLLILNFNRKVECTTQLSLRHRNMSNVVKPFLQNRAYAALQLPLLKHGCFSSTRHELAPLEVTSPCLSMFVGPHSPACLYTLRCDSLLPSPATFPSRSKKVSRRLQGTSASCLSALWISDVSNEFLIPKWRARNERSSNIGFCEDSSVRGFF